MNNNSNLAEEKCPRQEGSVIFRGKDLRQMSTETRKLLANERYLAFFFFSCLWSCTKSSCYCPTWVHLQKFISSTALIFYFFLPLSLFLPWFAWKMTWMLLCRHVSIVLIDSVVIYILNYNDIDIFIFHKHLLWKIYIVKFVIGWILFLVK